MSNLSFFEFKSNRVRTVVEDGDVLFCLGDVLKAMGSETKVTDAKTLLLDELGDGFVTNYPILDTIGRSQMSAFIRESGLTFLLSRSRTEIGKQLNRLIHTEILPSLRKTGKYQITPEAPRSCPD